MTLFVSSVEVVCLRFLGECGFPSFTLSAKFLLAAWTLALWLQKQLTSWKSNLFTPSCCCFCRLLHQASFPSLHADLNKEFEKQSKIIRGSCPEVLSDYAWRPKSWKGGSCEALTEDFLPQKASDWEVHERPELAVLQLALTHVLLPGSSGAGCAREICNSTPSHKAFQG